MVGTSGSGKSTLLHMLGGLDRPTSGLPSPVDGRENLFLKDEALTIFRRRKIGFVFQNYNLVPVLNVYENIVLPSSWTGRSLTRATWTRSSPPWAWRKNSRACPTTSPAASSSGWPSPGPWRPSPPSSWPTSPPATWTPKTSQDVMGLLKVTSQRFAQTIVMITHNEEIAQMADRIVRIEDGRITTRGEG